MTKLPGYRSMLLRHLEQDDPKTLAYLRRTGELEDFLGIQLDAVKWLRESRPPHEGETGDQKWIRQEIERATLLEYQKPYLDPLEDLAEQTAQERDQLASMLFG